LQLPYWADEVTGKSKTAERGYYYGHKQLPPQKRWWTGRRGRQDRDRYQLCVIAGHIEGHQRFAGNQLQIHWSLRSDTIDQ
jgi:hypothetical protein